MKLKVAVLALLSCNLVWAAATPDLSKCADACEHANRCFLYSDCFNCAKFSAYHQAAWSVQISTDSLALARYTQNHEYTYGLSISPYTYSHTTGFGSASEIDYNIFGRKNFPIFNQAVFGVGLELGSSLGSLYGNTIKNAVNVAPYVVLEYALTPHFLLGASVDIVNYQTYKLASTTTQTTNVLDGGALQLAYLF